MEFISNLIKRPISLVLSDTVDVSAASPTNSNNSNSNSPSGAQLRERFSPIISNNNNSNGGNNNAHNMLKNNNNNKTSMNCRNSPTIPDLVHEANRNAILPLIVDVGAGGDGLHTGHCDFEHAQQLNSSASSNSTSSTIEELLIQINDNLNQATLQNQSGQAVGSPETLSGIAALTSPLGVKSSSSNKLSQSPNLQTPITPTVFNASPLPNVAAGSAVIDLNALKIKSDAVAGKLDKTQLILNNNNTGVTKKNKFVGLTEFDESKIPELPESLNTNIGEQLKLTFDEDLIPTLTASTNTQLNLPNKKDDATKSLQVIFNETDTAVSSDNETYAECQSFPDFTNTTNTIDLGYGDHNTSLSEADTYRSALNSYNNTTIGFGGDETKVLNDTLENIADIGDEVFDINNTPAAEQLRIATYNATYVDSRMDVDVEPMDVDLNETHDLAYTTNVTIEADRLHCGSDPLINEIVRESSLDEFKNIPEPTQARVISIDTESAIANESTVSSLNEISSQQQQMLPAESIEHQLVTENHSFVENMEKVDLKQVETVEIATKNGTEPTGDRNSNQANQVTMSGESLNVIQDNSIDSATDNTETTNAAEINLQAVPSKALENQKESSPSDCISSSMSEAVELSDNKADNEKEIIPPQSSPSVATVSTAKLPLEINTSIDLTASNQKPPLLSPSFPIKAPVNSKYFPRSPDIASKPMIFLEKSDYSVQDVIIVTPVKKHSTTKGLPLNLNSTMDVSDTNNQLSATSPLSTSQQSSSVAPKSINNSTTSLNGTFDGASSLPSPKMISSATELETTSAEKRRTFNASPTPNTQQDNSLNSSRPRLTLNVVESEMNTSRLPSATDASPANSVDKRRTFNASPTSNLQSDQAVDSNHPNSISLNCTFDGVNSLPSPKMTSSATELETTSSENAQQDNSLNSSRPNSRLTFNVVESDSSGTLSGTANASPPKFEEKRRTFNDSPTSNLQSDRASDSSRPNSRLTFNVAESELTVNNESVEAMDVDISMQAESLATVLPRNESSTSLTTSSVTCSTSSNATILEQLSAKEQTQSNAKDEKDIFIEKPSPQSVDEEMFKSPALPTFNGGMDKGNNGSSPFFAHSSQMPEEFAGEDFHNNLILNPSDFDYLLTKGNNNVQVDRSSLLLRFDPLLGVPIPVNQPQQQQQQLQQILANSNNTSPYLCPTIEEDEQQHHNDNNRSFVVESAVASAKQLPKVNGKQSSAQGTTAVQGRQQLDISQEQVKAKKNVRMSVDVIKDMKIENDCNKAIENSNTQSDDTENNIKMDELEKKIKNEVLKTEDIEKKLKEAEQREEALIKRITEKDKKIAKMNDVIEAYEKAIAELISEKEQLIQNYEKQLTEVKADRDSNYHHLTSLETTFSDLHVKYEKSKEMTSQLKASEESLLAEKKQNLEGLRLQEQRYEKMKNHAMQQLEIANKKLESLTKEHAIELTKLKASLKKEEISRASINEQLQQKSRENAELVKICDELINGQGS